MLVPESHQLVGLEEVKSVKMAACIIDNTHFLEQSTRANVLDLGLCLEI